MMLPVTSGVSRIFRESTIRRPTPGHANTVSVRTLPPNTPASWVPMMVIIGINAFLKAWDVITIFSGIPFALAVLKYSCFNTSSIEERVVLVSVAISPVPMVIAGSTMDDRV